MLEPCFVVKGEKMSNVSDLKPWFQEDLARMLMSIYFTSMTANYNSEKDPEFRSGFASALSSVAIMVGINPESFLASDDIKLLSQKSKATIDK
jgi:hypothetical protein